MSHEHEHDEVEYVFIPDEEGNEERFEVIYKFDTDDGRKYLLLVPADEDGDDSEEQEVLAFRYEEEGDDNEGLTLYTIESDEEWDLVEEAFNTFAESEED